MAEISGWRARAEELRTVAEDLANAIARDAMLDMADGYERLADRLEAFHAKTGRGGDD